MVSAVLSRRLTNAFSVVAISALTASASLANDADQNFITSDPSGVDYALLGDADSPEKILVLLHGSGDSYLPLASGAAGIVRNYEDLLVIVPNGPVSFAEILPPAQIEQIRQQNPNLDLDNMRNWAGPINLNGDETEDEIMQLLEESQYQTADALNVLIEAQLDKYGLEASDVSLYGFSAGGSMAMYTGLRADHDYAEILNHSGALYGPYENPPSTPPISIIIGDREAALLPGLPVMVDALEAEGVRVSHEVLNNTGHEFNQEAMTRVFNFIDRLVDKEDLTEPSIDQPVP